MKFAMIVLALLVSTISWAGKTNPCENNFASARLPKAHAKFFLDTLRIMSSMPMNGYVEYSGVETAVVKVFVDKDFADRHKVDSFDIAKKLKAVASARPEWRGAYIQAFTCSLPLQRDVDTSNAGSIGHGGK